MRRRSRLFLAIATFLAFAAGAGAGAQEVWAASHPRALIAAPVDGELLRRIRGQTSDLRWEFVVVDAPSPGGSVAHARLLVESHPADAVLWFAELPDGGWHLRLADVREGRLLQKRVAARGTDVAVARSAASETAALVVRSWLTLLNARQAAEARAEPKEKGEGRSSGEGRSGNDLRSGGDRGFARRADDASHGGEVNGHNPIWAPGEASPSQLGRSRPKLAEAPATPASADQRPAEIIAQVERPPVVREEGPAYQMWTPSGETPIVVEQPAPSLPNGPIVLAASLGLQSNLDGIAPAGQHGIQGKVAFDLGPIALGLRLAAAIPAELRDSDTKLDIGRYSAAAVVERLLGSWGDVQLALEGDVGIFVFRRVTAAQREGVLAAPPNTSFSPGGALALELRWLAFGHFGFALSGGADVVVGAPILRYMEGDTIVDRNKLWIVQPRATLGVVFVTGGEGS